LPLSSARITSFRPVAHASAQRLILGSMPGARSLAANQYYAHPQNAFWKIMGELHGFDAGASYRERTAALKAAGIALWDVLHSCERAGSLDAAIEAATPNDFAAFFRRHPAIRQVFFNGATAERYFRRHVLPALLSDARPATARRFRELILTRLPSTSPAHAGRSCLQKLQAWRATRS